MITAIVEFQLPRPLSLEEARTTFQSTAQKLSLIHISEPTRPY